MRDNPFATAIAAQRLWAACAQFDTGYAMASSASDARAAEQEIRQKLILSRNLNGYAPSGLPA